MARVKYVGPAGAVNRDVGRETGEGDLLEPGREYDVPQELVKRLVDGSPHWQRPKKGEPKHDEPAKPEEEVT